ncbi:MAG TPA: response regulator [Verrucomicrobiae bacterium]|nr:response regulator [Verrucomicrobiae bacterium]
MSEKIILLVEDDPDDEELTLRALRKRRVSNEVVVVRDGQEALDYLFGTGSHAGRDVNVQPEVVLLDIKLPKINGIDVLKRIRSDERTKLLPVVILTSSAEEQDLCAAYVNHVNSYVRKPVDFEKFVEAVEQLQIYWLVLNRPPPACIVSGMGR